MNLPGDLAHPIDVVSRVDQPHGDPDGDNVARAKASDRNAFEVLVHGYPWCWAGGTSRQRSFPPMPGHDYPRIEFRRLTHVSPHAIVELMNQRAVRRHLPLAQGHFGPSDCDRFVAAKERMWEEHGYGPWAFVLDDEFIGWGGLQPEGGDVDVALVLDPSHWGAGRVLYKRIIAYAFGELGNDSVTILLPPSRKRRSAIQRLGFCPDGEVLLGQERFLRYRLTATDSREFRQSPWHPHR